MEGFVSLHRKMFNWGWYTHPTTSRLFIHLLLLANHTTKEWMGQTIQRGQLITGRKELAKQLKISEQSVRTSLKHLKSTNEITIKISNKFSLITVNNYDSYQISTNKLTNNQPATNQQLTTTNNDNNDNKKEKNIKKKNKCPFGRCQQSNGVCESWCLHSPNY